MRRMWPIFALVLAAGCNDRPRAPALRDEPVYENRKIGLRFLTPDNWVQVARSEQPLAGERDQLLVRFQGPPGQRPAIFEITGREAGDSADVLALLREPSHSVSGWQPSGVPAPLSIDGAAATRYTLMHAGLTKEVVVFRRHGRLFFFTLVAPSSDAPAREQIRQVIQSVQWSD